MFPAGWPIATKPMTALLGQRDHIVTAVATATGYGDAEGVLRALTRAVGVAVGVAAADGYLRGDAYPVGVSIGSSEADGFAFVISVGGAQGHSYAVAVSYVFYFDPEVMCVHCEDRVLTIEKECREYRVPVGDEDLNAAGEWTSGSVEGRKRDC